MKATLKQLGRVRSKLTQQEYLDIMKGRYTYKEAVRDLGISAQYYYGLRRKQYTPVLFAPARTRLIFNGRRLEGMEKEELIRNEGK